MVRAQPWLPAVVSAACAAACGGAVPAPMLENHVAHPPPPIEISLERTTCFGTCPAYKVTIHGDGRVDWIGKDFVTVKSPQHAQLTAEQVDQLIATIERIDFFHLDHNGLVPPRGPRHVIIVCSDTPHSIVTVVREGAKHVTENEHCMATPVATLETEIDQVVDTARWIGRFRDRGF